MGELSSINTMQPLDLSAANLIDLSIHDCQQQMCTVFSDLSVNVAMSTTSVVYCFGQRRTSATFTVVFVCAGGVVDQGALGCLGADAHLLCEDHPGIADPSQDCHTRGVRRLQAQVVLSNSPFAQLSRYCLCQAAATAASQSDCDKYVDTASH